MYWILHLYPGTNMIITTGNGGALGSCAVSINSSFNQCPCAARWYASCTGSSQTQQWLHFVLSAIAQNLAQVKRLGCWQHLKTTPTYSSFPMALLLLLLNIHSSSPKAPARAPAQQPLECTACSRTELLLRAPDAQPAAPDVMVLLKQLRLLTG
jgi:hypothetical protein